MFHPHPPQSTTTVAIPVTGMFHPPQSTTVAIPVDSIEMEEEEKDKSTSSWHTIPIAHKDDDDDDSDAPPPPPIIRRPSSSSLKVPIYARASARSGILGPPNLHDVPPPNTPPPPQSKIPSSPAPPSAVSVVPLSQQSRQQKEQARIDRYLWVLPHWPHEDDEILPHIACVWPPEHAVIFGTQVIDAKVAIKTTSMFPMIPASLTLAMSPKTCFLVDLQKDKDMICIGTRGVHRDQYLDYPVYRASPNFDPQDEKRGGEQEEGGEECRHRFAYRCVSHPEIWRSTVSKFKLHTRQSNRDSPWEDWGVFDGPCGTSVAAAMRERTFHLSKGGKGCRARYLLFEPMHDITNHTQMHVTCYAKYAV